VFGKNGNARRARLAGGQVAPGTGADNVSRAEPEGLRLNAANVSAWAQKSFGGSVASEARLKAAFQRIDLLLGLDDDAVQAGNLVVAEAIDVAETREVYVRMEQDLRELPDALDERGQRPAASTAFLGTPQRARFHFNALDGPVVCFRGRKQAPLPRVRKAEDGPQVGDPEVFPRGNTQALGELEECHRSIETAGADQKIRSSSEGKLLKGRLLGPMRAPCAKIAPIEARDDEAPNVEMKTHGTGAKYLVELEDDAIEDILGNVMRWRSDDRRGAGRARYRRDGLSAGRRGRNPLPCGRANELRTHATSAGESPGTRGVDRNPRERRAGGGSAVSVEAGVVVLAVADFA